MTNTISVSPSTGIVITGGGSGIGRATAHAVAEAGRAVALWDLNGDAAAQVAGELRDKYGTVAVGIAIDVRDTPRFPACIAESREKLGTIGGLVHGAGITGPGAIDVVEESVWDATLAIHLKAGAMLIRDLTPDLTANPGSAIVVISSIEGIIAHEAIPAYCSAKAGLLGLMRSTAARLGPRGVRSNAICPGFIETPMFLPSLERDPGARAAYEQRIPLRRLGRPEDIGRVARFLLSDDAAYITGAEIVADGGVIRTTF
ncbi:MAG TPA: SDR family NAD(P)-dependent oxidoreductase [Acidimicrobiales bacterium]|jgi:NAD(P)-dependent dehydrogenase (short-subunit alcohol dehydrogenase family)|nr:SDR family NAD(P)-dependent oxidoreductase [Acidimicrobiales bacterium]